MSQTIREVNAMPRRDATGPMGAGSVTGKGLGNCAISRGVNNNTGLGMGLGFACRHGFGGRLRRSLSANQGVQKTKKELLEEQKDLLENRLKIIDEQLENL